MSTNSYSWAANHRHLQVWLTHPEADAVTSLLSREGKSLHEWLTTQVRAQLTDRPPQGVTPRMNVAGGFRYDVTLEQAIVASEVFTEQANVYTSLRRTSTKGSVSWIQWQKRERVLLDLADVFIRAREDCERRKHLVETGQLVPRERGKHRGNQARMESDNQSRAQAEKAGPKPTEARHA